MIDDETLVEQFKKGDLSAFDKLMERHWKSVYYLALRMTNNRVEDAEDITQEVFEKVFKSLPSWKPRASFRTWLHRVASNLCVDKYRARLRRQTQSLESKEGFVMDIPTDAVDDPLRITEADELQQRILQAAAQLSPRQQKAFLLCRYGDMPLKDAAEIMGCAIGTIKAHLHRATEKMRDLLEDLADEHMK